MQPSKPSNLELQILAILWEQGPLPIKAINDAMPDGKERAYTTVLTIVQSMEKKGLVTHTREGNRHIYRAKYSRKKVLHPYMSNLVTNLFGGNPASAMQFMLGSESLSENDIDQLRKMLDEMDDRA